MIKLYYNHTYVGEVNTDYEFATVQDMFAVLSISHEDLERLLEEEINDMNKFSMVKSSSEVRMNYYAVFTPDYNIQCDNIVKALLHIKRYCIVFNSETNYTKRHLIFYLITEAVLTLELLGIKIELERFKINKRQYYRTLKAYANSKHYVIKIYLPD